MLGEVPRKADQLVNQVAELSPRTRVRLEARLAAALRKVFRRGVVVGVFGEAIDEIGREPERLAHIANGRPGAVTDRDGRQPGPVATVLFVEILEHLFAAFMLEVDVDVRGFVAFAADESLEQQVDTVRIDRSDAQAVADGRVRGGTASLAENAPRAGEPDEVPDSEEVRLVAQIGDQCQFMFEELPHFVGKSLRIAPRGTVPGELLQIREGGEAIGGEFFRVLVAKLGEREGAAVGDLDGACQRVRQAGIDLLDSIE